MPTRVAIDHHLILEAKKPGQHRTANDAVTAALEESIRLRKQPDILELFGKIEYDARYDYKRE
jgi:hypothetical protein